MRLIPSKLNVRVGVDGPVNVEIVEREAVTEQTQLRDRARRHGGDVRIAVAVVIKNREGAAILIQVESCGSRD
jgi:hypothetical protein